MRKVRMPQYNRAKLAKLQGKFDVLEAAGNFARLGDVGVNLEYSQFILPCQKIDWR